MIVSLLTVVGAFGISFWQNHQLLRLIDTPLGQQTQQHVRAGRGPLCATHSVQRSTADVAKQLANVVALLKTQMQTPAVTASLGQVLRSLR